LKFVINNDFNRYYRSVYLISYQILSY